MLKLKKV